MKSEFETQLIEMLKEHNRLFIQLIGRLDYINEAIDKLELSPQISLSFDKKSIEILNDMVKK